MPINSRALRCLLPLFNRASFLILYEREEDGKEPLPHWITNATPQHWLALLERDETRHKNLVPAHEVVKAAALLRRWGCLQAPTQVSPLAVWWTVLLGLRDEFGKLKRDAFSPCATVWRAYADPWLLEGIEPREQIKSPDHAKPPGIIELHAHFRGSIPFDSLWHAYLTDLRTIGSMRRIPCVDEPGFQQKDRYALIEQDPPSLAQVIERARMHAKKLRGSNIPVSPPDGSGLSPELRQQLRQCMQVLGDVSQRMGLTVDPHPGIHISKVQAELRAVEVYPVAHTVACLHTCRGILIRQLLHQREQTGLVAFTKQYNTYSNATKLGRGAFGATHLRRDQTRAICENYAQQAANTATPHPAILELRPTVERRPLDLVRYLRAHVLGYLDYLRSADPERPTLALGLVYSFFKQEKDPAIWLEQADVLIQALETEPGVRPFVVGIDFCGRERGISPRAFKPVWDRFRAYHRRYGLDRVSLMDNRLPITALQKRVTGVRLIEPTILSDNDYLDCFQRTAAPRLGLTCHLGEDFDHPLTGLRAVEEGMTILNMQRGDRLGHALVLGLTSNKTYLEARLHKGVLLQPRGERLADLIWSWVQWRRVGGEKATASFLELAISSLTHRAFGVPCDVGWLLSTYERSYGDFQVPLPGFHFDQSQAERLTAAHLEPVPLSEIELQVCDILRKAIIQQVQGRGVVVESCPTSNLAIVRLEGDAPLKQLLDTRVPVVLASDDPAVTGSSLSQEWQHVQRWDTDKTMGLEARLMRQARLSAWIRPD